MNSLYLDCLAFLGVGGAHPGGLKLTKDILSREKLDETTSILDAGCGTGQTSAYIAMKYGSNVSALDHSSIMLEKARTRFSSLNLPIETRQGSVENLPYNNASFDMIISESVIAFTDNSMTIPELQRVLKPNGILLAIEMVLEKSLSEKELRPAMDFYGISRLFTESEWHHALHQAGFQDIRIEKFHLPFENQDVENAPDFVLSENMDDHFFEILDEHRQLTKVYENILSYRLFRCAV